MKIGIIAGIGILLVVFIITFTIYGLCVDSSRISHTEEKE